MHTSTMAVTLAFFLTFIDICLAVPNSSCVPKPPPHSVPVHPNDVPILQFALNLEFTEAEYFLYGSMGYGLNEIAPELAMGGPRPIGARKANLNKLSQRIMGEFVFQEVGHLRAIKETVGGFPRPLIDLSSSNFAKFFDAAVRYRLNPPFDPYRNTINYMLSTSMLPYLLGIGGYVGANPYLKGYKSKRAVLLGVESKQDAVIRIYLYERAKKMVHPYNHTVEYFTTRISMLRNRLGMCGIKDEGLFVSRSLGTEHRTTSNVLSANSDSLSHARIPEEILRFVYLSGNVCVPGGFLPKGAKGVIAREIFNPTRFRKIILGTFYRKCKTCPKIPVRPIHK